MNTITQTFKQIGFFTIALTLALFANFAYGQWANPTAAPTGGNIAAPINTSGEYQEKYGDIGAGELLAASRMRSDQYCNLAGDPASCFSPADVSGGGGGSLSALSAYHTRLDLSGVGGSNCSCGAGDILTGCSGFQSGDRTTAAVDNSNGPDYCRNEGTGQFPICSCLDITIDSCVPIAPEVITLQSGCGTGTNLSQVPQCPDGFTEVNTYKSGCGTSNNGNDRDRYYRVCNGPPRCE